MNRQDKWRAGIFAAITMTAMATLVIWLLGDNKSFEQSLAIGAIGGLIAAPLLIWMMGILAKKMSNAAVQVLKKQTENMESESREQVLRQTNATHFHKMEGVGGVLILTPERLIFQSHGMNIHNHAWEVALSEIQSFKRRKTLGLIPNGLEISAVNSEKPDRFVVMGAAAWHNMIQQAIDAHA